MRFYFRARTGGVSVGVIGAVLLGIAVATVWFYVALVVVPTLVLAGIGTSYGECGSGLVAADVRQERPAAVMVAGRCHVGGVRGAFDDNDERWTFEDPGGLRKLLVAVVPEHDRAWLTITDNAAGTELYFELDAATARTVGRILLYEFHGPTEPMDLPPM